MALMLKGIQNLHDMLKNESAIIPPLEYYFYGVENSLKTKYNKTKTQDYNAVRRVT